MTAGCKQQKHDEIWVSEDHSGVTLDKVALHSPGLHIVICTNKVNLACFFCY